MTRDSESDPATLLHCAGEGHEQRGRELLEAGCDVDGRGRWGQTALHYAARSGHASMVELLLEHGAEVDALDERDITPLMGASAEGHFRVVELLTKAGAVVARVNRAGRSAAEGARSFGHTDVVAQLRQVAREQELDSKGEAVAQLAGWLRRAECTTPIARLLSTPPVPSGSRLAHVAARWFREVARKEIDDLGDIDLHELIGDPPALSGRLLGALGAAPRADMVPALLQLLAPLRGAHLVGHGLIEELGRNRLRALVMLQGRVRWARGTVEEILGLLSQSDALWVEGCIAGGLDPAYGAATETVAVVPHGDGVLALRRVEPDPNVRPGYDIDDRRDYVLPRAMFPPGEPWRDTLARTLRAQARVEVNADDILHLSQLWDIWNRRWVVFGLCPQVSLHDFRASDTFSERCALSDALHLDRFLEHTGAMLGRQLTADYADAYGYVNVHADGLITLRPRPLGSEPELRDALRDGELAEFVHGCRARLCLIDLTEFMPEMIAWVRDTVMARVASERVALLVWSTDELGRCRGEAPILWACALERTAALSWLRHPDPDFEMLLEHDSESAGDDDESVETPLVDEDQRRDQLLSDGLDHLVGELERLTQLGEQQRSRLEEEMSQARQWQHCAELAVRAGRDDIALLALTCLEDHRSRAAEQRLHLQASDESTARTLEMARALSRDVAPSVESHDDNEGADGSADELPRQIDDALAYLKERNQQAEAPTSSELAVLAATLGIDLE